MIPEIPAHQHDQAKAAVAALNETFQPLADKLPIDTEMAVVFQLEAGE
jgi:hypothetical protein